MNSRKKILIVADDLAHFKATNPGFDQIGQDWEVHYSQSSTDACFCVRRTKFNLIFVELQAGPVAGSDLIYDLRLRQPEPAYFLIGPSVDSEILAGCAQGSHQFLQKPLDSTVLQAALDRAELVQDLLLDPDIQKLVAGIRIFPSHPRVYVEIMRKLRSEHSSAVSVGELVAQDLAISTKLLQVINSAWFGLQQKVSSPIEAVLHLGMETTASLVLALEVFAQFDHLHPNYFAIEHVWKHCQTVADNARRIAEEQTADSAIVRDAYTAGLLHDIGKLALSINIKEEYGGVLRLARQRGVPVWRAELETFGTTHAAVGGYLLAIWGLPAAVVQAVAGHHNLACSLPEEFTALTAVHLANTLEYMQPALRRAFQGMEIDTDYPPGLGLDGYFAPFAENSALSAAGSAQLLTA